MTNDEQTAANRLNSQHSTGPRSDEGKAVVSTNAVRHGLLAKATVLPDEEQADFDAMRAEMLEDLAPFGMLETALVDRLCTLVWRLRRVGTMESAAIAREQARRLCRAWDRQIEMIEQAEREGRALFQFEEYADRIARASKAVDYKTVRQLATAARYAVGDRFDGVGGAVNAAYSDMLVDSRVLDNLSRYEVTLHREFDATLKQLWVVRADRSRKRSGVRRGPEVIDMQPEA